MKKRSLPVVPERSCGSCRACCVVFEIPAIDKPACVDCSHLKPAGQARACTIYEDRPQACRDFKCMWLLGTHGIDAEHRPDRVGMVFSATAGLDGLPQVGVAYLVRERADVEGEGAILLARLSRRSVVIVVEEDNRRLMGPTREVEEYVRIAAARARKDREAADGAE